MPIGSPIFLIPGRLKRQRRCPRCGLYCTPDKDNPDLCPHCKDLTDAELVQLQQERAEHAHSDRTLGWTFVTGAAVLLVVVLLLLI